jgi:hypothetical protein
MSLTLQIPKKMLEYLQDRAKMLGISPSKFVDHILDSIRPYLDIDFKDVIITSFNVDRSKIPEQEMAAYIKNCILIYSVLEAVSAEPSPKEKEDILKVGGKVYQLIDDHKRKRWKEVVQK